MTAPKWHVKVAPGVRYREHATRKHGVKRDRYFSIYYRVPDPKNPKKTKLREEGLGWSSEGMSAEKALFELGKLKEAKRTGEGPRTLREKREKARRRKEQEAVYNLTFAQIFKDRYLPVAEANKAANSVRTEKLLFDNHIKPVIGHLALKDILVDHIEKIKAAMAKKGRAEASIRYTLATIRQTINFAKKNDLFNGDNVISKVKKPQKDNAKKRYLTPIEAETLIAALRERSIEVADLSIMSLYSGMRFSEVARLKWGDINWDDGQIFIRDTKNVRNRHVDMAEQVRAVLERREKRPANELIFKGRKGAMGDVSRTFDRTVEALGLNEGVDRLSKITFHNLRHTAASWMLQQGIDLFTIGKILGHRDIISTQRYSHVSNEAKRQAIEALERQAQSKREKPRLIGKKEYA